MDTICLRGATWRLFPCILWQGVPNSAGYGTVYVKGSYAAEGKIRTRGAHVDALIRKLGRPLREGFEACHHCDVKLCIQPEHLYEGTHRDNVQDAQERRRYGRPHSLTLEQRDYVKTMIALGETQQFLADELHVSRETIRNAIRDRFVPLPDVPAGRCI